MADRHGSGDGGPGWRDLADQLAAMFPAADLVVGGDSGDGSGGEAVLVGWRDGPSRRAVEAVVTGCPGYVLASEPAPRLGRRKGTRVALERTFSEAALAVAVVRFAAAHPRPYDGRVPDHRADLADLLEHDDPASSGYPVVDAVARLLLAEPDPPPADPPEDAEEAPPLDEDADRLSRRLRHAGYDRLWAIAWSDIT